MMSRTQISLDPEDHRAARRRAAEQGISLAEYVRRLVHEDLTDTHQPKADISAIFDLGDSGGSDVANHKHEYVGEAVDALHPRR
jgi:HicB family